MIRLGPFELDSIVGRGGMAEVWRARHLETETPVAVKVLTNEHARDEAFVVAFREEVRAVGALDHPHIVTIHDHGLVTSTAEEASEGALGAGSPYFVMELASGGTLAMQPAPVSYDDLRAIVLPLLDALGHAHARGLVHRDIKPANVLRCVQGDVRPGLKLADFGVARPREPGEERTALGVAGTLAYMSPEQAAGRWRDQGPWSDLYALGCLTFRLACGHAPYSAQNVFDLVAMQMETPRPAISPRFSVPAGFADWLAAMLAVDPSERFGRAADAAFGLECLGHGADVPPARGAAVTLAPPDLDTLPGTEVVTVSWPTAAVASLVPRVLVTEGGTNRHPAAPMPATWRTEESEVRPTSALVGAGLGLFGVRPVPFVGREAERDRLWAALERVRDRGASPVVLLEGATGCGKSRLAQWLCERAHETGAATPLLATHAQSDDASSGLAPMLARHLRASGLPRSGVIERVDLALGALGSSTSDERFALAEVVAPFSVHAGTGAIPAIRLGSARERYEVILRYLERLARHRPAIVWLDDLQWSIDSWGFVLHVLERHVMTPIPLLVVATVREEVLAEDETVRELHGELARRDDVELLRIGPLAGEHWSALVRGLLGLEGDLALRVEQRAAGNPQFAVQLVGDWVERGVLRPSGRGFRLQPGARAEVPAELREVWDARVDRVLAGRSDAEAIGLELAAVLGRRVDSAEWNEVCAIANVEPPHALVSVLLERRLATAIDDGSESSWELAHALLREGFERHAARHSRLASHHRACADALVARGGAQPDRLGRHLLAAGEPALALEPLLRAAQARVQHGEFRDALALLGQRDNALDALSVPEDDERRCEGWVVSALAALHLGRIDAATRWASEAERHARAHGWQRVLSAALLALARVESRRGDRAAARLACEQSEHAAAASGDVEGVARALLWQGVTAFEAAEYEAALEADRRALDAFIAIGDEVGAASAIYEVGLALHALGDRESATQEVLRALELSQRLGVRDAVANALNSLGEFAREDQQLDLAERYYRAALAINEAVGSVNVLVTRLNLGLVLLAREQWSAARATFDETRTLLVRAGWRGMLAAAAAGLLASHAGLAHWSDVDSALVEYEVTQVGTRTVDPDVAAALSLAARLAAQAGESARASRIAAEARTMWILLDRTLAALGG